MVELADRISKIACKYKTKLYITDSKDDFNGKVEIFIKASDTCESLLLLADEFSQRIDLLKKSKNHIDREKSELEAFRQNAVRLGCDKTTIDNLDIGIKSRTTRSENLVQMVNENLRVIDLDIPKGLQEQIEYLLGLEKD